MPARTPKDNHTEKKPRDAARGVATLLARVKAPLPPMGPSADLRRKKNKKNGKLLRIHRESHFEPLLTETTSQKRISMRVTVRDAVTQTISTPPVEPTDSDDESSKSNAFAGAVQRGSMPHFTQPFSDELLSPISRSALPIFPDDDDYEPDSSDGSPGLSETNDVCHEECSDEEKFSQMMDSYQIDEEEEAEVSTTVAVDGFFKSTEEEDVLSSGEKAVVSPLTAVGSFESNTTVELESDDVSSTDGTTTVEEMPTPSPVSPDLMASRQNEQRETAEHRFRITIVPNNKLKRPQGVNRIAMKLTKFGWRGNTPFSLEERLDDMFSALRQKKTHKNGPANWVL